MINSKLKIVEDNRNNLQSLVLLRIELNDNIFELTKRVKVLEGKTIMYDTAPLDKEKKRLSLELRALLQKVEENQHCYTDTHSLEMEIHQKERLKSSLYNLLEDLNDKIKFAQDQIYEQSFVRDSLQVSKKKFSRSFMLRQTPKEFNPLVSTPNYSFSYGK